MRPFDFNYFEELYDVRIVLELAAVSRLCGMAEQGLERLEAIWRVDESARLDDAQVVCALDEEFHCGLVQATGNAEMARMHYEITEKIRIIRRLDFTQQSRIAATYEEHASILDAISARHRDLAQQLLKTHIEVSKQEDRLLAARETFFGLLPLIHTMFVEPNPAPVKAALAMEGLIGSELRAPMLGASETVTNRLQQVLGVRQ